ncbi:hypothetical protein [Nonomuraea africana]|uniref:hypothetical protein n=1 Tax=Nonomuraea africana TaxID=46171 RepID=UPI0030811EE3
MARQNAAQRAGAAGGSAAWGGHVFPVRRGRPPDRRRQHLHSHDSDLRGQVEVHAIVDRLRRDENLFESATSRLSLGPAITSVSWTVEQDDDEDDSLGLASPHAECDL